MDFRLGSNSNYRRILNFLKFNLLKLVHLNVIVVSINFVHEFRPRERNHKYDGKKENCLLTIAL